MPSGEKLFADLRTCAYFDVSDAQYPGRAEGDERPFRDPAGVQLLEEISSGLSEGGYRVSRVKPAIGVEAGCNCYLPSGFRVDILLGVSRKQIGKLACDIIIYHNPSLRERIFGKFAEETQLDKEEWADLCRAMERQIIGRLGPVSISWLTRREASVRWRAEEE